jgi:hypothetical protein
LRAWRGFWKGFFIGALLWLSAVGVYKIFPVPIETTFGAALVGLVFSIVGFFHGWTRPMTLLETARWIDEKEKLQERLSTALELSDSQNENWKELLLADAAGHARKIDSRRLLPAHLPAASKWALLVLALGAGLGFLPEYRSKSFLQKQNDKAVIKEVGKQLSDLSRRTLVQRPPALEKTKENLETIEQLGAQLGKAPVTRSDALKEVSNAAEKIKNELKELGRNPAFRPLERAARESSRNGGTVPAELQKQIDALQKSLGEKAQNPDALDKLKSDLQKTKQTAAALANQNSAESADARQQLAQSLADLAQQANEMGLSLENLDEAISALKENQPDIFLKDLDAAMSDLEKTRQMAKSLQKLQQQAASRIGKDLAEQLKNGQAEAAQSTLEKMVAQLKNSNLSADQIQKLLSEVSKAIDPAGEYGKVKDFLSDAANQMKERKNSEAAQSLASAAKELEKLSQQMRDAESLAESLDALKRAQQSIGSGQGWAQGRDSRSHPGYGTGFWAKENWLYDPDYSARQDSSKTSAGNDPLAWDRRGEGKVSDNLLPDKLHGEINPGSPMPSITLKGVSIKGQSTVGYKEAVEAAQTDAQSALNHDEVPRAYQGAVKNYFDDLKE